jgi:glycosyltransferase involved in cell wall biosynthesis
VVAAGGGQAPSEAQASPASPRVAVYTDYVYHRVDSAIYAERAFALFIARLAAITGGLVLLGRLAPGSSGSHYPLGDAVEFVPLPYYTSLARPFAATRAMAASLVRFWRVLADVDAVWLLGPHPLVVAFAAMAAVRGRRVILGVRQDMPGYVRSRHPRRPLLRFAAVAMEAANRALARLTPVVVVGPDLARRYRRSRRLLEITVSLVDAEEIVSPGAASRRAWDGELSVLSVGRLEPEKNPLLLADVLALLRRDGAPWRLVVCGEGPMETELLRRLDELGLGSHAELRGYLPLGGDLRDAYRESHALLHVSWTEGLPQVLFEAFAAGLPVVATDVGGVAEAVGAAALIVPPGDSQAAAAALRRIAADADLRVELIGAGNALVRRHTIEAECRRVADFVALSR